MGVKHVEAFFSFLRSFCCAVMVLTVASVKYRCCTATANRVSAIQLDLSKFADRPVLLLHLSGVVMDQKKKEKKKVENVVGKEGERSRSSCHNIYFFLLSIRRINSAVHVIHRIVTSSYHAVLTGRRETHFSYRTRLGYAATPNIRRKWWRNYMTGWLAFTTTRTQRTYLWGHVFQTAAQEHMNGPNCTIFIHYWWSC